MRCPPEMSLLHDVDVAGQAQTIWYLL